MGLIESTKTIINDIVQVRPTFIVAVPTVSTGFMTVCGIK